MKAVLLRATVAGVLSALAAGPAFPFQDEGTVRIGSMEAQTGVPAPYGTQALNGSKIAIEEINAAGGVTIGGKQIDLQLTPQPDGYDPGADNALTLALIKKLALEDDVLAIKGTSRSQNTEVAFNYLTELEKEGHPLVLMSSASASPDLGKITEWGFRNSFFEAQMIDREVSMLANEFGYKTAGLYTVKDNQYPAVMSQYVIKPALERHGIEIVAETEGLDKDSDLSNQVNTLRQANPDIVFVASAVLSGINLMKEAARRGLDPKIWVGTIGNIAPEVPELGGEAVEGMIMGSSFSPQTPSVRELMDTYKERYGSDINMFGVNGYEAMYLFKAALEKADLTNTPDTLQEDRRKFRDALANVEIHSVTGERVRFNDEGDGIKDGFILTIKDGEYVEWDGKPFE